MLENRNNIFFRLNPIGILFHSNTWDWYPFCNFFFLKNNCSLWKSFNADNFINKFGPYNCINLGVILERWEDCDLLWIIFRQLWSSIDISNLWSPHYKKKKTSPSYSSLFSIVTYRLRNILKYSTATATYIELLFTYHKSQFNHPQISGFIFPVFFF